MIDKIKKEVHRLCDKANVPVPGIDFTVVGTCAGKFIGTNPRVDFNLGLANDYGDEFIARTVVHEVAHYVRYYRNGDEFDRHVNGRRDSHGKKWRTVMEELGAVDCTTYHKYEVSKYKTRKYRMFEYMCPVCGSTYNLTTIRHNRATKGTKYICRQHDIVIKYVREVTDELY
jgi:SprT protein